MRTLKFKAQPTNAFFVTVNRMFGGSWALPSFRLLPYTSLNCAQRFDYLALGSSRKLGGAPEHFIDGTEESICRLSFEFRVRMLLKGAVKGQVIDNVSNF